MKFLVNASSLALLFSALLPAPNASAFVSHDKITASISSSSLSMSATAGDEKSRNPNPAIKVAAQGMTLLKPIFQLEAQLQAAALGAIAKVDKDEVAQQLADTIKSNKVLIYTYGLSPFSSEAVAQLEASGYDFTKIELGAEWFLLGGTESETRVALSKYLDSGATSLPKIFIGGNCIGGCADLAALVESGELDATMKKAGVSKKGALKEKKGAFAGFSLFK